MNSRMLLLLLCMFLCRAGLAQTDTAGTRLDASVFDRITKSIQSFKPDTSEVPDDKMTRKIMELRTLRGGFNIDEAVAFKLEEDRQKNEMPAEEWKQLSDFFTKGNGKKWLNNAMIWIYRNHFTYKELKQLVRFYKTSAGQKMAEDFPIIMMQSLAAAMAIKEGYDRQHSKK